MAPCGSTHPGPRPPNLKAPLSIASLRLRFRAGQWQCSASGWQPGSWQAQAGAMAAGVSGCSVLPPAGSLSGVALASMPGQAPESRRPRGHLSL